MTNKKQPLQRYTTWKQNVATTSMFIIVCGFIAAIYFCYRLILIALPVASIERSIFNPPVRTQVVCQEDKGTNLHDPLLLPSSAYQARIQRQSPLSANLVMNADLAQIDDETSGPSNYTHSVDDDGVSYEYLAESSDDTKFLRVANTQQRTKDQISPAWQMDAVQISPEQTYAYSFWYRSSVPVYVSIDYAVGEQVRYKEVTTLDASGTEWRQFTGHFDNIDKAKTLRIDVNGEGVGQVDSRGFNIHQIPNAKISKGVVSVTFDDGWRSVRDKALPLLEKYDIHTTQYIITETAEHKVAGYLTYNDIAKLKASGHEIGSHSLNHCNQTELSLDTLQTNATKSKQELENKKLGPIKTFAYPLGEYNEKTQTVYEKQYSLIRSSNAGYNDRYYDETNVDSMAVLSDTNDEVFQSWLAYAKTHKVWLVLTYHRIDESGQYSITSEQLDKQLKMIQGSGLAVMTMSDAAAAARK